MSIRRRIALLEWANRSGCAIIEDDYDSEFRFGGRPIEPLQALDAHGRVVYVGSFSKTMLPTLRLGFLVAPPSLRPALETAEYLSDWHSPLATQGAMARFVADGHFARHVRRMRTVYQARHALMIDGVARSMADHLEVVPSAVGLHVAAFARGAAARRVDTALRHAASAGVACYPLSMFSAHTARPGLVLGYGAIAREQIGAGIARLSEAFQRACSVTASPRSRSTTWARR